MKRLKKILVRFALVGISLILFLCVAEIALRLAGYGKLVVYRPHKTLFWVPAPAQKCLTKIGRKPVRINSRGTRGPEFQVPKPEGLYRILCSGDSRTFGWGLSEEESSCGRLKLELEKLLDGKGPAVEVINAGVNGWSFEQMEIYLREEAPGMDPDLILLGDGNFWVNFGSDASDDFRRKMAVRIRLKNLLRRSAIYHFVIESQLKQVYARFRAKAMPRLSRDDEVVFQRRREQSAQVYEKAIRAVCEYARVNQASCILYFTPRREQVEGTVKQGAKLPEESVRRIKSGLAKEFGIPFVDMTEAFMAVRSDLYLEADPVHPNAVGAAIVGKALAEVAYPLIRSQPKTSDEAPPPVNADN